MNSKGKEAGLGIDDADVLGLDVVEFVEVVAQ
jgi:hypothetical protein